MKGNYNLVNEFRGKSETSLYIIIIYIKIKDEFVKYNNCNFKMS